MNIPYFANIAIKRIQYNQCDAYLVGGCVRDMVMGKQQNDIDITTNMLPDEIEELFCHYKTINIGKKHGTVTVIIDNNPIEITTYRIENGYDDNRHPNSVSFNATLIEDLSRRDFTMNALCYNEKSGLIDKFNGIEDIKNKCIRAIGEPKKRFSEDALRILRAFRFMAQLGFSIEKHTLDAIYGCKDLLNNISFERITIELKKLMMAENCALTLLLMNEMSVLDNFIKPLKKHDIEALKASNQSLILRLAIVMTKEGIECLCFDTKTKVSVKKLICHKCDNIIPDKIYIKRMLKEMTYEELIILFEYKSLYGENLSKQKYLLNEIISNNECYSLKQLKINGNDIINCGIKKGIEVGKTLNLLLEKVITGELKNNNSMLIEYVNKLVG